MAACPNCGRRTLRTKDWVCQWCGYPLLYGGFKQIDKTYKELQEERNLSSQSEEPETEPDIEYEPELEPEPEPKPEPQWKLKRPPKPAYPPKAERAPTPEPEAEIAPEPEPEPEPAPMPPPRPRPVAQPRPEPAPQPAPQPEAEIAPEPVPQPALRPVVRPRPEPPPPPREEPQPEPLKVPSLESITNGTTLSIDQIDALFRADNVGANAALKDKTLVIKGVVNKVFIRDHLDVRYMILSGTRKGIWNARCSFEKESVSQMSRLSEGQAVALRGKYDGYSKNIIFKECELVGS